MEILLLGNELLRQKAERIKNIDAEIKTIAEELIDIMHKGERNRPCRTSGGSYEADFCGSCG